MLLGGGSHRGSHRSHRFGRAELSKIAYADFGPGAEAIGDNCGSNVVFGNADGCQQNRRLGLVTGGVLATIGIVDGAGRQRLGVSALDDCNCQSGSGFGFSLDTLIDGHALLASKYELDTTNRCVLTGHGDRLQVLVREGGVDRACQTIIGGNGSINLAFGRGQHLLEDRLGLGVVPIRYGLVGAFDVGAIFIQWGEHFVVATGEQGGVVVGGGAIQLGNDGLDQFSSGDRGNQTLALKRTNGLAVKAYIEVRTRSLNGQAVIVDDLGLGSMGFINDRGTGTALQVNKQDDLRAICDGSFGLCLPLGL